MEVIHARCAGIDVHKRQVTVCVRIAGRSRVELQVRQFGTMTADLLELSDWLRDFRVEHVAMESTGAYWKPVYNILEDDFKILLANAQHMKTVPGRKTDVKDAQWIAELHAHGLLRPSFVPKLEQRALREMTRTRTTLLSERARLANRIQKVLEDANIKLASVASDVLGVSGRAMLRRMILGECEPKAVADLARGTLRKKIDALEAALTGRLRPHHRIVLAELLNQVESLDASVGRLDAAIDEAMKESDSPYEAAVELIQTIPGGGIISARAVLAEIGTDMSQFPNSGHISSWTGICPGNKQSAGKRLSTSINPGNKWLKTILVQMAHSAAHQKGTYLHALYCRTAARRGKKRAIVAVAHSILMAIYHMLKDGDALSRPWKRALRPTQHSPNRRSAHRPPEKPRLRSISGPTCSMKEDEEFQIS
jgi:transposase